MAEGSLSDVFARVESRFRRVESAQEALLVSRKHARLDALEDLIVHGCALTIVMQNCRRLLPGFDDWYKPHAEKMATDPGMRRFYKMRSEVLKEGRLAVSPAAVLFQAGPHLRFPEPPTGAVAYIPYDHDTGQHGWLVRHSDGSEEKVLADLPADIQVAEFLTFSPPTGSFDDLQVEMTANRYVSHLREMVDELRILVLRATAYR